MTDAQVRRLAEQHRREQIRIKAGALREFTSTWSLLDWNRLDETAPAWIQVSMDQMRPWRQASADAAIQHYAESRAITAPRPFEPAPTIRFTNGPADLSALTQRSHGVDRDRFQGDVFLGTTRMDSDPRDPKIDWTDFDRAAEHALRVTGPGELKRQAKMGRTEKQAKDRGLVVVSGSISRQVLNGGRAATLTSVASDQQAIGWARLTDGDPCAFCALLASRGPAYKTEASAGFQAHDACACIAVAVFSKAAPWPGRAAEFRRLYDEATKGFSGKDARNAFRRAHDAKRRAAAAQPAAQTA